MGNSTQIPEVGFLRLRQIVGSKRANIPPIIPVSASTWWAGIKAGKFPKPLKLGPRITAWRAEDIRKLVEQIDVAPRIKGESP